MTNEEVYTIVQLSNDETHEKYYPLTSTHSVTGEYGILVGDDNKIKQAYLPPAKSGDKFVKIPGSGDVWTLKHNMEKQPSVTVVDSAGTIMEGEVTYLDDNNCVVSFTAPFTGIAYLN